MNVSPDLPVDDAKTWRSRGAAAARKLNAAWWLDGFAPGAIIVSFGAMAAILYLRSRGIVMVPWIVASSICAALGLAGLISWLRARRHFINETEGMVRLESHLKLHNALSAADAGVRSWPQSSGPANDGLRWRPGWLHTPSLIAIACLLSAFLVPVPVDASSRVPTAPPRSQAQIEEMLQKLEQSQAMKKEDLQKIREQLDQLRKQKAEEWYSHNSLEAADTLKQHLEQSAGNMAENLEKAAGAMESLQKFSDEMSQAERDRLAKEYENAVSNLSNSNPGLNQKLMDALKGMDPSAIKSMSSEQMKQMMEGMKKACEGCKQCSGSKPGQGGGKSGGDMNDMKNDGDKEGNGNGQGDDKKEGKNGPGKGGVGRGPGTAPLDIGEGKDLETNKLEPVQSSDFSRALPGDGVGVRDGEHDVDKTSTGPVDGGAAGNTGEGGDAVGRESLLPEEKGVLKKYFR